MTKQTERCLILNHYAGGVFTLPLMSVFEPLCGIILAEL